MSLITRCPACQTLFKVVPDQLRISEGWVRCGQCDEIFDASLHLVPPHPRVSVAASPTGAVLTQPDAPPLPDTFIASTFETETTESSLSDELPAVEGPLLPVPEDRPLPLSEQIADAAEAVERVEQLGPPVEAVSLSHEVFHELEHESRPEASEVSFLRQGGIHSAKPRLFVSATWALLSVALFFGLAGQIVLHERDRIAALHPDLKPWLKAMCSPLNCRVSSWRQIDSIVIESSAFTRIRDDFYRLTLTLKNTANVTLALPALELTLTNSLDQPVVRRVLLSTELEGTSDEMAAGFERPVSLAVSVKQENGSDRIAGYRLLAFYP